MLRHHVRMANEHISNNTGQHRYELTLDGNVAALINYRLHGSRIDLIHTEVTPEHEGKGLASRIAAFALDDARRRGLTVTPSCSYVAKFIERHPQYADIVTRQ
jgi:uncharacterized protein